MTEKKNSITYFAQTNFRNERIIFGIKKNDRTKHFYVVGKTGMGKTTLLENMAAQDIKNGEGLCIVDPHGSFAEKMLDYVPKERIKDVIYFNPADNEYPIAVNIMEAVGDEQRYLVASGLMGVFKKMWPDVWSARMEYILNNAILALLEYPGATLLGVNRMLADKEYRKLVVANISDPVVKAFWEQEFAKYTDRFAAEATPAIQNKVGQFTSNPLIRNIIGQPKSSFDFRKAMDERKILIMNLSKGKIGELNSNLLGAMLITKIYLAAMSRAKDTAKDWPDFYLHVDEFQNFATESFKDILSEARKYKLALLLAHQYIAQMEEDTGVRDAVFGNVGTHVVFRVGPADAEFLETEFTPEFMADDIVNLGFTNIYLKLSIDGVPSRPFSATTLPPVEKPKESFREEIIDSSRKNYCGAREEVEKKITEWHLPIEKKEKIVSDGAGEEKERGKKEWVGESGGGPKLFNATCAVCEAKTLVPFEPDGKRPTYCQKHRSYIRRQMPNTRQATPPVVRENILEKETPPAAAAAAEKPRQEQIKPHGGQIESRERETVSFVDIERKTRDFKKDDIRKKTKPAPDLKSLRELLADTDYNKNNENGVGEKILKPGDTIKF